MKVIEQFIKGKRGDDKCEDAIVVTDHFVAVIDGSTSKSSLTLQNTNLTGGQIAASVVKQLVKAADPMFDLWTFCHHATEMIQMEYHHYYGDELLPHLEKHPEDRFSCSAIVYSRHWNEIWMIGDCQGLIIDKCQGKKTVQHITNEKPQEKRIAKLRSGLAKTAMTTGLMGRDMVKRIYTLEELRRYDISRDYVVPLIIDGMKKANKSYSVIDGFPVNIKKCKVYADVDQDNTEIVLATDGYPRLYPTLKQSETYLQKCLDTDPLFIRLNPMTKGWMEGTESFDDRAYIRFKTF